MCHRKHALVVDLIRTSELTINLITWSSIPFAIRATALNHEIWNYPVKDQAIVKALIGQICKIFDCFGSVLFKELNFHHSFFCVDFSYLHSFFIGCLGKIMIKCVSNKIVYQSEQIAEDALIEARTRFDYSPQRGPVAVYRCEDCGYFHLTSKGAMNQKLSNYIKDGKLDLQKEADRWLNKLKRK
jgi:hypothetical protein